MLKKATLKIFPVLIITAWAILGVGFCMAEEKKNCFCNEELQSILRSPVFLYVDEKNKDNPLNIKDVSHWDTFIVENSDYQSEIENPFFCKDEINGLDSCSIDSSFSQKGHYKKMGKIYIHENKIKEKLLPLAEKIDKDPVEGKIEISDSGEVRVISLSKSGYKLDINESCKTIQDALIENPEEKFVKLTVNEIKPKITSDEIGKLGIVEKIGEGESNFVGSPKNRIHNIYAGVSKFHGLILDEGEEFSFVKYLGPVDGEHGYKPELVIKNNETIPEFGGGICQVSTTMFRAALNTGFKITARKNHAYPVQYYAPQGTDATVYIPNPDLKFVNNTSTKILIQGKIEGTKLTFTFYGTDDGREVEIKGPVITKRNNKNQMWASLTQIVKDKNGEEIINKTFKSFYDDPAKYHTETTSSQVLTKKPKEWSKGEWKDYKKAHGL
jgi:vancomycin resistance protein YoaR